MGKRAVEHVGDDLHIAVRVGGEAGARRDAVVIDHAQRLEAHVGRVAIAAERERVPAVEPAPVGAAALVRPTSLDHPLVSPFERRGGRSVRDTSDIEKNRNTITAVRQF